METSAGTQAITLQRHDCNDEDPEGTGGSQTAKHNREEGITNRTGGKNTISRKDICTKSA